MSVTSQQVARLLTEDRRVRMLRVQKRSLAQVYGPVVHGRVWWVMEAPKTTQHALKVFQMWKLDTVQKKNCQLIIPLFILLMELFSNLFSEMNDSCAEPFDICHVIGHLHSCSALSFNDPHPPPEFYKKNKFAFCRDCGNCTANGNAEAE